MLETTQMQNPSKERAQEIWDSLSPDHQNKDGFAKAIHDAFGPDFQLYGNIGGGWNIFAKTQDGAFALSFHP